MLGTVFADCASDFPFGEIGAARSSVNHALAIRVLPEPVIVEPSRTLGRIVLHGDVLDKQLAIRVELSEPGGPPIASITHFSLLTI